MINYCDDKDIFWESISDFVNNVKEHYPFDTWSTCYVDVVDGSRLYFDMCSFLLQERDIMQSMIDSKDSQLELWESILKKSKLV